MSPANPPESKSGNEIHLAAPKEQTARPVSGQQQADVQVLRIVRVAVLVAIWLVATAAWSHDSNAERLVPAGLDPNSAPWWELTMLPDIGPELARRITHYRDAKAAQGDTNGGRVFRTARDLDAVPGIGPKRIEGISEFLAWPESDLSRSKSPVDHHGKPDQ